MSQTKLDKHVQQSILLILYIAHFESPNGELASDELTDKLNASGYLDMSEEEFVAEQRRIVAKYNQ